MTLPVTVLPRKQIRLPLEGIAYRFSDYIERRKQARPYNLPLAYSAFHVFRYSGERSASSNYDSQFCPWWIQSATADVYESTHQAYLSYARTRAIIKFNASKGATASAGIALFEARESMNMITHRVTQLARAANALRKFRFYDAAKALDLVKDKRPKKALLKGKKLEWTKHPRSGKYYPRPVKTSTGRRGAHAFSNHWLEYSFGWAPLVSDVMTGLEVLDEPLKYNHPLREVGGFDATITRSYTSGGYSFSCEAPMKYRCLISAVVTVENPNKDLMRRMGLVNLASVAWDAIPFSFVLGWFVNVDAYLKQFTEYYGVKVESAYYTEYTRGTSSYKRYIGTPFQTTGSMGAFSVRRTVGSLPNVKLGLKPAYAMHFGRAITQSSLLVKLFTEGRALPVGVRGRI